MGIQCTLVDPTESRGMAQATAQEHARDLRRDAGESDRAACSISSRSRRSRSELGLALVVDSTFATPVAFRPIEHGADVVIHSATKFLNGHHDVIAGAVLGTATYVEEVRQKMIVWGQAPDPFACWLLERGLKTLDVRVQRATENAMRVALWCATRPELSAVLYPGLPDHPDHEIALATLDGMGAMLAIVHRDGGDAMTKVIRRLQPHHARAESGRRRHDRLRASFHVPRASLAERSARRSACRMAFFASVSGIEDPDDIIADLDQALRG